MAARRQINTWWALVWTGVLGAVGLPQARAVEKWENLFVGGKDLTGWDQLGGGKWSVENGEIVGQTGDGRAGWLVWQKECADFVLELEGKLEASGNSGIQFRSNVVNGKDMLGYQADFDADVSGHKNGIYDQGGKREWIKLPVGPAAAAVKPNDWNSICITAIGDTVKIEVNDVVTVALSGDTQYTRGLIALQVHPGKEPPVRVRWRSIRLKVLNENKGFEPLFNGRNLKGWNRLGAPLWRVVNGELVGVTSSKLKESYLVSDKEYRNFHLKLKFFFLSTSGNRWHGTGNSGLFFRCPMGPPLPPVPDGLQVEIGANPGDQTGLLYQSKLTGGRGWINLHQWDEQKGKMYHQGQWNQLELRVVGPHFITHLNGYPVSDVLDDTLPRDGFLALQAVEYYGGQATICFKDIYLRRLPEPNSQK